MDNNKLNDALDFEVLIMKRIMIFLNNSDLETNLTLQKHNFRLYVIHILNMKFLSSYKRNVMS